MRLRVAATLFAVVTGGGVVSGCIVADELVGVVPGAGGSGGGAGAGGSGGEAGPPLVVFGSPTPTGCDAPTDVVAGSVDDGGTVDAVVGGACASLLPGGGDGSLGPGHEVAAQSFAALALGDVVGTTALDVVGISGQHAVVLGNDDHGVFHHLADITLGFEAAGFELGDVNHDGQTLVVASGGHELAVYRADASFVAHATFGGNVFGLALADFDGDGDLDAAVASDGVQLARNDGAVLVSLPGPELVGAAAVRTLVAGLVDDDDCPDVVAIDGTPAAPADGHVRVLLNACHDVTLVGHHVVAVDAVADVALGDVDGDGRTDLVLAQAEPVGAIAVLPGAGDGTFGAPLTVPLAGDPRAVVLADVDADGDLDALVALHAGAVAVLTHP
jgi:VCBS repeat protein